MKEDIQLVLRLYLNADAPEGPGWYVYAMGESPLIPAVRVAPPAADIIAEAFERIILACPPGTPVVATPKQIMERGHQLLRHRLKQELEFAESQARRVQTLRQSLQAIEEISSGTVDPSPERQESESV